MFILRLPLISLRPLCLSDNDHQYVTLHLPEHLHVRSVPRLEHRTQSFKGSSLYRGGHGSIGTLQSMFYGPLWDVRQERSAVDGPGLRLQLSVFEGIFLFQSLTSLLCAVGFTSDLEILHFLSVKLSRSVKVHVVSAVPKPRADGRHVGKVDSFCTNAITVKAISLSHYSVNWL